MRPNANWSILVQICPERTNHPQINSAWVPVNYLSTYLRLKSVLQYWSPLDDVLPSLCHAQLRLLLLLLRRRLVWADARSRVDQLLAPVVVVVVLVGVDFEGRVCFSIFALKFIWKEFIPRICRRLLLCFLPILLFWPRLFQGIFIVIIICLFQLFSIESGILKRKKWYRKKCFVRKLIIPIFVIPFKTLVCYRHRHTQKLQIFPICNRLTFVNWKVQVRCC